MRLDRYGSPMVWVLVLENLVTERSGWDDNVSMDRDVERVRSHFDKAGEREWERLAASVRDRVSLELHRRLLGEWIHAGDRVLEVGAGAGRFTIELGRLGAQVTVTDVSSVQLELNERHVTEAELANRVEARFELDIRRVAALGASGFDAVVAYGGSLSYVFEDAGPAFGQLVQAVKPEGVVLASVMTAPGSWRYFLPVVVDEIERLGTGVYERIMSTGDLREIPGSHSCQMFRWREVEAIVADQPCDLVAVSASNCLSLGDPATLERLEANPELWAWFLDWEAALCRERGVLDAGTHVIFAARRHR
jgi:SAM-dependent methyltransferase